MLDIMFEVPSDGEITRVEITREVVQGKSKPTIERGLDYRELDLGSAAENEPDQSA